MSVPIRRFVNVNVAFANFVDGESVGNESIDTNGNLYEWHGPALGWVQTRSGGAALVSDAISLSGNTQGAVSLSTTAAQSAALSAGVYDVWADVDCYIKVAATANDVTTSTGYLLLANNTIPIIVPDQERIGGIVAAGTGTLSYHRVN